MHLFDTEATPFQKKKKIQDTLRSLDALVKIQHKVQIATYAPQINL
jgi:hypothetical protein